MTRRCSLSLAARCLLLFALCSFPFAFARAQSGTATLSGTVTDPNNAVVPGAGVTVTNNATGLKRQATTGGSGTFTIPLLPPSTYTVLVENQGFTPAEIKDVILNVGANVALNIQLKVGQVGATIDVRVVGTAQQLLDPTTSTLGQVITERPVQDLPLNGRNYTDLISLNTGVAPPPQGSDQYFVNGTRGTGTAYLIEGVDTSSAVMEAYRVLPNLEAIDEFKITTNNFNAEYGRSLAGIVNTHIRSGTNTWHGSVFEYFRNTVLDARNFFDADRLPYNYNQFGGSLGGPIVKDKLFIFGDYQGTRIRQSSTVFTNLPTVAEAHGDFSDLLPGTKIYDPTTFPRVQFPNNIIPPNRLDPASALMFSLLPPPNASGPFNYIKSQGQLSSIDSGDGRVDYNPTANDRISGLFVLQKSTNNTQSLFGDRITSNPGPTRGSADNRVYSLNYTHVVNQTTVNEFTVAWTRTIQLAAGSPGWQYEPTLGIPGLNNSPNDPHFNGFPLFVPQGYNFLGGGLGGPANLTHNIPQFSDSLSFTRGNHAFKTGFSAAFRQFNLDQSFSWRGFYLFVPFPTSSFPANAMTGGNSVASALLGYPFLIRRQILPPLGERIKEYGAYFQDDFRAAKRLTLNLGLRWDLYMPATEAHNRLANFDPSTLTMRVAGINGVSNSTLDTNWHNFSPHLGFAYQATSDGKTVVRGGYAIGYLNLTTQEVGSVSDRLVDNPPYNILATGTFFPLGPVPPFGISVPRVSDGFPLAPQDPQNLCCGVNPYHIPKSQPMSYSQQWNLDIQRALPGDLVLDVAYVGTRGVHLTGASNPNQAPPGPTPAGPRSPLSPDIGEVHSLLNRESSFYHALQVKLERRFSSGFYLMGAYTFSKSIDDGSITTNGGANPLASSALPQDSTNWRAERGLSDFDLRHRMVVSYIYELPFGKGKKFLGAPNRYVDALLGGWQMNGITSAHTGSPFTPRLANGQSVINTNSGPSGLVRPYLVGNPNLSSGQTINHWFNVAAFAAPGQAGTPAFTFGNAGRNILRGPDFVNFDFSLFKNFSLTERLKLQFRSEFFNIFNHPNFGLPNPNVDLPQAGIIRTAAPPRQIQFALKLLF